MNPRPSLAVITDRRTEPVAARVRRLQDEARGLAREHVNELTKHLLGLETMALEIAAGGDAYSAGVRDLCRRLADDAAAKAQTLAAINQRGAS